MSAIVKPNSERGASAFVVSLLLHGSLVLLPILNGAFAQTQSLVTKLPNNVAMVGNSIEVEAPTAELATSPGTAELGAEPQPVDLKSLPTEAETVPEAKAAPEALTKPRPAETGEKVAPVAPVAPRAAQPGAAPKPMKPPRAVASSAAAAVAGSEAPTTGVPAAGTLGQEGLAPGVRRLGYAFTRAIPAATPADSAWRELPTGKVGTIRIELAVDENNRLGAMKQWQARAGEPAPPAVLTRMVERTLLLLRAGQFALSGSNQPGTERLVIDVQLRDEAAEGEGESVVVQKGFDGASPGRPGRAHFRYGNGRAFEAKVTIVPVAPR
jgi:hypothetical protein